MKGNRYEQTVDGVLERQLECASRGGIIFTVSLSDTQMRAEISAKRTGYNASFFLYPEADDAEAAKVLKRIDDWIEKIREWDKSN